MGALHQGHISLIETSCNHNDITLCSIFVNPTQFNNPEDFKKYPVQIDSDLDLLAKADCNMVFIPDIQEMYPEKVAHTYNLGGLDNYMEGQFRPGHFQGVAMIVHKFLELVMPDNAYFGEKDFQQLMIIKFMVQSLKLPVQIIPCPIIREADGLAMSSRNQRLSEHQRAIAPEIFRLLKKYCERSKEWDIEEIKQGFSAEINAIKDFQLDYFEIADENTLRPIKNWDESHCPRAFTAIFMGKIRLIDNMKIIL